MATPIFTSLPVDSRGRPLPGLTNHAGQFLTLTVTVPAGGFKALSEATGYPTALSKITSFIAVQDSDAILWTLFDKTQINFLPDGTPYSLKTDPPAGFPLALAADANSPKAYTPPFHPDNVYVYNPDASPATFTFVLAGELYGNDAGSAADALLATLVSESGSATVHWWDADYGTTFQRKAAGPNVDGGAYQHLMAWAARGSGLVWASPMFEKAPRSKVHETLGAVMAFSHDRATYMSTTFPAAISAPATYIIVGQYTEEATWDNNRYLLEIGASSSNRHRFFHQTAGGHVLWAGTNNSSVQYETNIGDSMLASPSALYVLMNGASSRGHLNGGVNFFSGQNLGTVDSGTVGVLGGAIVGGVPDTGASWNFGIDLKHLFIVEGGLSVAGINALGAYLEAQLGISHSVVS